MYFIVCVDGCLPFVSLILNEDGEATSFDTEDEAGRFASENCAWDYQIVEFK